MMSDDQLFDFINLLSSPATLKERQSGKYIYANSPAYSGLGMSSLDQVIGATVHDLSFSKSNEGSAWAKEIERNDWLAWQEKRAVRAVNSFLNEQGLLIYQSSTKCPLLGHRGNVVAIVSFGQILTQQLSRRALYVRYKSLCGRERAINKLLRHLQMESWFAESPTEMELLVLIERSTGKSNAEIAELHKVTVRTVEAQVSGVRAKLKGDALPMVLDRLRDRDEIMFDDA